MSRHKRSGALKPDHLKLKSHLSDLDSNCLWLSYAYQTLLASYHNHSLGSNLPPLKIIGNLLIFLG